MFAEIEFMDVPVLLTLLQEVERRLHLDRQTKGLEIPEKILTATSLSTL